MVSDPRGDLPLDDAGESMLGQILAIQSDFHRVEKSIRSKRKDFL